MTRCIPAFAILAALLGCAYHRQASYVETEYAPYAGSGTSVITGQAFLKTVGGDVKYGAGNLVYLRPVTSYSTEWLMHAVVNGESIAEAEDPRANRLTKTTRADGEGRFRFDGLPAGSYYLTCEIVWMVPSSYGLQETGGVGFTKVSVSAGEQKAAIVSR